MSVGCERLRHQPGVAALDCWVAKRPGKEPQGRLVVLGQASGVDCVLHARERLASGGSCPRLARWLAPLGVSNRQGCRDRRRRPGGGCRARLKRGRSDGRALTGRGRRHAAVVRRRLARENRDDGCFMRGLVRVVSSGRAALIGARPWWLRLLLGQRSRTMVALGIPPLPLWLSAVLPEEGADAADRKGHVVCSHKWCSKWPRSMNREMADSSPKLPVPALPRSL
jgi:hypothetical protein